MIPSPQPGQRPWRRHLCLVQRVTISRLDLIVPSVCYCIPDSEFGEVEYATSNLELYETQLEALKDAENYTLHMLSAIRSAIGKCTNEAK
jgi:hypothetical protein